MGKTVREEPDKDRYVVVEWPDCRLFMDDRAVIHQASAQNAHAKFGNSAYFVSVEHYTQVTGEPPLGPAPVYLAVQFPESQLFMDAHQNEIHLINDERGIWKYGRAAYFIEEVLYKKALVDLERKIFGFPATNRPDFNC